MANEDIDDDAIEANAIANAKRAYRDYAAQLSEMAIDPKPTYKLDGQEFNWQEYQDFLIAAVLRAKQLIQDLEGPFEINSQWYL